MARVSVTLALLVSTLGCDDGASTGVEPDGATEVQLDAQPLSPDGSARTVDAAPEDAAPEDAAPEDAAPEDAAPEDAAPEDAAPEDAGADASDGLDASRDAALPAPDSAPPVERVFRDRYPIDAAFTEGGTYDPTGHAFFVGSLSTGGVYRIDANTGVESTLFEPEGPGVWWTLGMDIDVPANRLYVCAMDDRRELDEQNDYAGALWGFDLATGERVVDEALGDAAAGATCTDVAVAADGTVYINDRENPRLYAFSPEGELSLALIDDQLSGGIIGQNALLVLPDQSALLSLVYLPSRLLRISLPEMQVTEVVVEGDFFDGLPALSGADGMALSGASLLVMFTSQLNRLRPLTPDWARAISTTVDVDSGMTDVVNTPEGDYMLNGQAVQFAFDRDRDPSALVRFDGDL